jgi:predicted amidohydrolase
MLPRASPHVRLLANYAGTIGGHVSCGLSGVWTPSGEAAMRAASTGEQLLIADLDRAALDAFRTT